VRQNHPLERKINTEAEGYIFWLWIGISIKVKRLLYSKKPTVLLCFLKMTCFPISQKN